MFDWIYTIFSYLMKGCLFISGNYYIIALFFFALVIQLLLLPLAIKQQKSQIKMAQVRPMEMAIREKYKGRTDRATNQKMMMEIQEMYSANGYNQFSGCLPLLIQMPIMIGIFYGIRDYNYAAHPEIVTSFLWLADISKADPTYVLPVLSALTTFIQTKQTMPTNGGGAQNKMMMYFMPLFIGYISLTFPAGLVLYWVVMNIMQIAQQSIMNRAAAK